MSGSDTARSKRLSRLLRVTAAFVVLVALAGYVVAQYLTSRPGPARCIVKTQAGAAGTAGAAGATGSNSLGGDGAGGYVVSPEQAANAATISAVATAHRLPPRAVEIALATAMQESGLLNITHGDRDSLGLFQQRPSQGWGTRKQISDPVYATGAFYQRLAQVPDYQHLPLTDAAQQVQHSGFPRAYAKHEQAAAALAAALTGRRAAAFDCTTGPDGPSRAAGSAQTVRDRLVREFGPGVLPAGTRRASAGADAHRLEIPVRPEQGGWELAHWAVANAASLHITQVSYDGRVWNYGTTPNGWHGGSGTGSGAGSGEQDAKGSVSGGDTAVVGLRLAAGARG